MSDTPAKDRPFPPSAKKLMDARKKGELVKSADLSNFAGYLGLTTTLGYFDTSALNRFAQNLTAMFQHSDPISHSLFTSNRAGPLTSILSEVLVSCLQLMALPFLFVLAAYGTQQALVFAPSKLQPKLRRISLIQNSKQKFGPTGLFEFTKNLCKLFCISIALAVLLQSQLPMILASLALEPSQITLLIQKNILALLQLACAILLVIGAIDYAWQRHRHLQSHRMTAQEVKDEQKQSDGDPQVKRSRQQRAMTIAQNKMLRDMPTADVVIVNPTHFAVALRWSRAAGEVPICIAKGTNHMAKRIRDLAAEHGVPIHSDPPTARALFATLNTGDVVQPTHYAAVAAAIRFSDAIRQRKQMEPKGQ